MRSLEYFRRYPRIIPFGFKGGSHVALNEVSESPLASTFRGGLPGAVKGNNSEVT